ncbi:MAG TPA: protein kinase [Polyangiaceae bacterium]|nr:protein kinase [Polyangiaceae bacterium]
MTPDGTQKGDPRPLEESSATRLALGKSRYQMIAQIATSAWGPLWVARSADGPEAGRIVSIRRIGRRPPLDPALLRKLATCAFTAMNVRGGNVAAVLDVVVTGTEVAVVTEYVEGELLRSLQRRIGLGNRPIEVPVALRLALDLTRAAILAKEGWRAVTDDDPSLKSALHGGITPDSLLVATYGEPILFDVGVAGLALSRAELSDNPELVPYRAPEHLATSVADERSDVFTLGIVLWELLSNRPLFGSPRWLRNSTPADASAPSPAEEAARARHRVLEMPIPRLDAVVRAGAPIDRALATVVARALERNPADRPRTLDELERQLVALGPGRFATTDDVSDVIATIASTSLEARRLALASVTGQFPVGEAGRADQNRPTISPTAPSAEATLRLEELASSPDALAALQTARGAKPPPLPPKRRRGSVPDVG